MKSPEHFQVLEDFCCYRQLGHGPLAEATSDVVEVITFSREKGVRRLLIDTTGWTGHMIPDTLDRFYYAREFAGAARSAVKLAMVVRPALMDPEKIEVTVMINHGLVANVFDSEDDALEWLLDPATG